MDELQQQQKTWKKPDPKDHILSNSIYVKCLERASCRDRKQIIGCLWLGMEASDPMGMMGTFLMWWKCVGLW